MRTRALMVMLLAVAVGVLVPLRASATILPLCELQPAASMMPSPPEPTCETEAAGDDDAGDPSVAPMCDLRGASVVAPPRIFPVDDARIEAGRRGSCDPVSATALSPLPRDNPAPISEASTDVTTLATLLSPPPPADSITIDFVADDKRPRDGVSHDVYHPPRSLGGLYAPPTPPR